jgi:ribonuclease BN (tRNA processing enzyme)
VVFVECSFIHDDELENAKKTGHTHWMELKPHIQSHPTVTFVLIHFSRRYSKVEIEKFFENEGVHNIRLFVAPEDESTDGKSVHEVSNFVVPSAEAVSCESIQLTESEQHST